MRHSLTYTLIHFDTQNKYTMKYTHTGRYTCEKEIWKVVVDYVIINCTVQW